MGRKIERRQREWAFIDLRTAMPYPNKRNDIQMDEVRNVQIKVVDERGKCHSGGRRCHPTKTSYITRAGKTQSNGFVSVSIPRSERIESVFAWKDHLGADFQIYSLPMERAKDANAKVPEFPESGIENADTFRCEPGRNQSA